MVEHADKAAAAATIAIGRNGLIMDVLLVRGRLGERPGQVSLQKAPSALPEATG